jgi:hypothetical protein
MTFADWLNESQDRIAEHGVKTGGTEAAKAFWTGMLCRVGERWNYGTPIFEEDWDVLVVLDTCRPDVLEEVAHDYDYVPAEVPTTASIASCSPEWMAKNFGEEYHDDLAETAYVTANPFSDGHDEEKFGLLDEVWRYAWDDEYKSIPPEPVTDRAIDVMRERDPERLIIHYMQPHEPYRQLVEQYPEWFEVDEAEEDARGERLRHCATDWSLWNKLRHGEITREELWPMYRDTLRWVLDDGINTLLRNIDAEEVVLTADHAEAFGEWGIYAHPENIPVPIVKEVPWVRTSATDTGEYEPSVEPESESLTDEEVSSRLEALGYK